MSLSPMQKKYIWLAGSYPTRIAEQGRGRRTPKLRYALTDDGERLVLFGYSNPMEWLVHRGLFRPLQERHTYALTGAGEAVFEQLKVNGVSSEHFEQVKVKERATL